MCSVQFSTLWLPRHFFPMISAFCTSFSAIEWMRVQLGSGLLSVLCWLHLFSLKNTLLYPLAKLYLEKLLFRRRKNNLARQHLPEDIKCLVVRANSRAGGGGGRGPFAKWLFRKKSILAREQFIVGYNREFGENEYFQNRLLEEKTLSKRVFWYQI